MSLAKVQPGQPVRASDYNALVDEVDRLRGDLRGALALLRSGVRVRTGRVTARSTGSAAALSSITYTVRPTGEHTGAQLTGVVPINTMGFPADTVVQPAAVGAWCLIFDVASLVAGGSSEAAIKPQVLLVTVADTEDC